MSGWDGLLLLLLTVSAPVVTFIAIVLVRAAWKRPGIRFLTATALMTAPIAALVDATIWATANSSLGYPIGQDVVRIIYRGILLLLVLAVFRWYYVYRRTGFRDG